MDKQQVDSVNLQKIALWQQMESCKVHLDANFVL